VWGTCSIGALRSHLWAGADSTTLRAGRQPTRLCRVRSSGAVATCLALVRRALRRTSATGRRSRIERFRSSIPWHVSGGALRSQSPREPTPSAITRAWSFAFSAARQNRTDRHRRMPAASSTRCAVSAHQHGAFWVSSGSCRAGEAGRSCQPREVFASIAGSSSSRSACFGCRRVFISRSALCGVAKATGFVPRLFSS